MSEYYRNNEQGRRDSSSRSTYRDDSSRNDDRSYSPGWDERGDDRFADSPRGYGRGPESSYGDQYGNRGESWRPASRNYSSRPARTERGGRPSPRSPDNSESGLYSGPSRAYGVENARLFGSRHQADDGGNIYGTRTSHSPPSSTPHYSTGNDYIDPYAEYGDEFEYGTSGMTGVERYGSSGQSPYRSFPGNHQGRGPKGYSRSDERLRELVCERLTEHPAIDASDITVQVADQEVTLSGTVDDRGIKHLVEDLVDGFGGVREIHNQLRVRGRDSYSNSPGSGNDRASRSSVGSSAAPAQSNADLSSSTYGSSSEKTRKNS